jgi:hypothetical protein
LSRQAATEFLEKTGRVIDHELSSMMRLTVYVGPDGGALLDLGEGRGRLYRSREELKRMYEAAERRIASGPRLRSTHLPMGPEFLQSIPDLVSRLPDLLRLPKGGLDLTIESLKAVDTAVHRFGRRRLLRPDVFPALVAYVVEAIRRANGGQWEMRPMETGTDLEPVLIFPNGEVCKMLGIFEDLYEYGRKASLYAFAKVSTGEWRL